LKFLLEGSFTAHENIEEHVTDVLFLAGFHSKIEFILERRFAICHIIENLIKNEKFHNRFIQSLSFFRSQCDTLQQPWWSEQKRIFFITSSISIWVYFRINIDLLATLNIAKEMNIFHNQPIQQLNSFPNKYRSSSKIEYHSRNEYFSPPVQLLVEFTSKFKCVVCHKIEDHSRYEYFSRSV
jgi:hypothetical protein